MVSLWYKTQGNKCASFWRYYKFRFFGLIWLLAFICFNILFYRFFMKPICPPPYDYYINYDFEESKDDVLSDLSYAKAMSFIKPDPKSQKDEHYRNQMIYYQKTAANRTKRLMEEYWQFQLPETYIVQLNCPSMVRLGPPFDGGYGVCNPWLLAKSTDRCVLFSFGINELVTFEHDFYNITGQRCRIYLFDDHEEPKDIFRAFQGTFMRATISDRTNIETNEYSIINLAKEFGYDKKIDVLKVDIEGMEFSAIPVFLRKYNGTVCQLLLEFHANEHSDQHLWLRMFRMLERRGYFVFNRESNQRDNRCYQFSYLHISCFEEYGISNNSIMFTYFI